VSTAASALEALDAGENLKAFDLATAALAARLHDRRVAHTAVLALARSGATDEAERRFLELGLDAAANDPAPADDPSLPVDLLALHARMAKDRAAQTNGEERQRWARQAADRYEAAARADGSAYAHVNVAAMARLAGDRARSDAAARAALADLARGTDATVRGAPYWHAATRAEAHALLGELAEAGAALGEADRLAGTDIGARVSTRRQLRLLADDGCIPAELLDGLPVPGVMAFGGHRLACDVEAAAALRRHMDAILDADAVGAGFGSLACGADILWAEALFERGAAVHVVLPFDPDDFVDTSVRPGGEEWVARHLAILDAAASVTVAFDGPYHGHDELYGIAAALFLGRARIHAQTTTATARFGVVWDQAPALGPAGTGADVARWQRVGGDVVVVEPRGAKVRGGGAPAIGPAPVAGAALFGDFAGFSRLDDADLVRFVHTVLGTLGATLDAAGDRVVYRNSWGDGIFVVCDSLAAAATLALELQAASERASDAGLAPLGLRLAGHAGAMFPLHDPIQGRTTYWGRAVVTAARIEPRTPEGEVYVTEPFAALLALEPDVHIATEYVGHLTTAKGFGDLPMYVLRARPGHRPHPS
jgi:hypothetical protein